MKNPLPMLALTAGTAIAAVAGTFGANAQGVDVGPIVSDRIATLSRTLVGQVLKTAGSFEFDADTGRVVAKITKCDTPTLSRLTDWLSETRKNPNLSSDDRTALELVTAALTTAVRSTASCAPKAAP